LSEERCAAVRAALGELQEALCAGFGAADGTRSFEKDSWQRAGDGEALAGEGITALLEDGALFERGGVALSDVRGAKLPPAATARNPQLAGRSYRALGVSVVMHPRSPHIPTGHMNVRYFSAGDVWWFGGGFEEITAYVGVRPLELRFYRVPIVLLFVTVSCALFSVLQRRLSWDDARYPVIALLPLMYALALGDATRAAHPLEYFGYVIWPLAFAVHLWLLRRHENEIPFVHWWHAAGVWLFAALAAWEVGWWIGELVPKPHWDMTKDPPRKEHQMNLWRRRTIPEASLIHEAVFERMKMPDKKYRPKLPNKFVMER